MLGFTPEKLLAALGIDAKEALQGFTMMQAEVAAFKAGATAAVAHFNARLDRQDQQIAELRAMLARMDGAPPAPPVIQVGMVPACNERQSNE